MSNSRVKSEAEYDMIRSSQRNQNNNNEPNPFGVTNNANEYFDAITRRHKDDAYFDNPFEPSENMMQPMNQIQPSNNYMTNDLGLPQPQPNVSNVKQSIASNQSTGNISDDLSNPFETVSINPNNNMNPNMQNMNMQNMQNVPNMQNMNMQNMNMPNSNMQNMQNVPNYDNNQMQNYNNQMNHQIQEYNNNQLYNNQNPNGNGGDIKAMYAELQQKSLQNMFNTPNPEPMRDERVDAYNNARQMADPNNYNLMSDNNYNRTSVNDHYETPRMPQSNDQLTIAQQANKINELINGINRGSIGPELSYEGNFPAVLPMGGNPNPNPHDKAIMDDIDKELEAMLNESDLDIDVDKDDFTSENENLIEEIKRAESNSRTPARPANRSNENMDEIEKTLNEISENSGEPHSSQSSERTEKPRSAENNTQPDNAIDQMISELDNDKAKDTSSNTGKLNLSDTLSLALDKNEVMQISKEKMLEEDLEDNKKKKSKIDILINIVLLIMIIVVLGLVAKMILG